MLRLPPTAPGVHTQQDRMFTVINYTCYLGLPVHVAMVPLFFWMGARGLAVFNAFSVIAWIVAWWLNRNGKFAAAISVLIVEVVVHATLAAMTFGLKPGFQTPLMPLIAFIMINHRVRTRTTLILAIGLASIYSMLYAFRKDYVPPGVSPAILDALNYMHIGIVFAALCIISYFYREASLRAERRMEELATTDQLTKLSNRHRMRDLLAQEQSRSDRTGHAFALVITDVDKFKNINDTYGHDGGDFVLRNVAEVLRRTARTHDSVARWGGEEFLVLLPETEIAGAADAAERMRVAIEQEPFAFDGHSFRVTMTFGASQYVPGEDIEETLKRADRALYDGKHGGRNCVVLSSVQATRGVA